MAEQPIPQQQRRFQSETASHTVLEDIHISTTSESPAQEYSRSMKEIEQAAGDSGVADSLGLRLKQRMLAAEIYRPVCELRVVEYLHHVHNIRVEYNVLDQRLAEVETLKAILVIVFK